MRRLLQHRQEGVHRVVRVEQHAVALGDLVEQAALVVEHLGLTRGERRVAQLRLERGVEAAFHAEHALDGDGCRVGQNLVLVEFEALEQHTAHFLVELTTHLEAHRVQAVALLEELGDVHAVIALVIVELFLVKADVGVAPDAQHDGRRHRVDVEELAQVVDDDVCRAHEMAGMVGVGNNLGGLLGQRDDAHERLAVFVGELHRDVERLVLQMREGMACVDDLRRKDGEQELAVVIARELAFLLRELLEVELHDVVRLELFLHLLVDLVAQLDELARRGEHGVDLLCRGHVGLVVAAVGVDEHDVGQAAHAHHEELVEVAVEDGDELHALVQRHGVVERLLEHALVELEPGQLTVLRVAEVALAVLFHRPDVGNDLFGSRSRGLFGRRRSRLFFVGTALSILLGRCFVFLEQVACTLQSSILPFRACSCFLFCILIGTIRFNTHESLPRGLHTHLNWPFFYLIMK